MPLLIFLKQPNRAIAVKGDAKELRRIELAEFGKSKSMIFDKLSGGLILAFKDNISHIEEISEAELKKQKADYEKRIKQQKQRNGQLVTPNLMFPKGGRN